MNKYILTAVGEDRPGIVAAVSKYLFEHECNIEGSSMTLLQGEFSIILILSCVRAMDTQKFTDDLSEKLKQFSLLFNFKIHHEKQDKTGTFQNQPFICTVHGADQPGIVFAVTDVLQRHSVNITDVNTHRIESQNKAGYVMFLEGVLSKGLQPNQIENELKMISQKLDIQISFKLIESDNL